MKFVPKELKETAEVSAGHETWAARLKNLALVIGILLGFYLVVALGSEFLISRMSEQTEAKLFSSLSLGRKPDPKETTEARAVRVFEKLLEQPGLRPLPYKLHIMEEEMPNAFAAPGGTIAVTRGLLNSLTNEPALAFVIAHELGHQQHRHPIRSLGRGIGVQVALGLLTGGTETAGLLNHGVKLVESRHSRGFEADADAFGLQLAMSAYGPQESYFDFLEMMIERKELGDSKWLEFLSTHPASRNRLDSLKALAEELKSDGDEPAKGG